MVTANALLTTLRFYAMVFKGTVRNSVELSNKFIALASLTNGFP